MRADGDAAADVRHSYLKERAEDTGLVLNPHKVVVVDGRVAGDGHVDKGTRQGALHSKRQERRGRDGSASDGERRRRARDR